MKKMIGITLATVLTTALLSGCGSSDAGTSADGQSTEKITISTVTPWPREDQFSAGYRLFEEKLLEKANGKIEIVYRGGPESIAPTEQAGAVKTGVVDLAYLAGSYYVSNMPEIAAMTYANVGPDEELKNGARDYINEINQEKMNSIILSRAPGTSAVFYTNKEIKTIADYQGLRIRTAPAYVPFVKALGMENVTVSSGEIYSALEKGIVDAVASNNLGTFDQGYAEQVKYKIFPPFYGNDIMIIMNLDKFNSLPADIQELIKETALEVEKEVAQVHADMLAEEEKNLKGVGMEFIEMTDAEAFDDLAQKAGWDWVKENSPEHGAKLEELFSKK